MSPASGIHQAEGMTTTPQDTPDPEAEMSQLGTTTTTTTTTAPPPADESTRSAGDESSRPAPESDRLHRGGPRRMLAGVAVGLADYFDVDPILVRVGFVALSLLGGLAVPLYLAGWLLIPDEGAELSVAEELLARERSR